MFDPIRRHVRGSAASGREAGGGGDTDRARESDERIGVGKL
jgi:hypothetical protein